MCGRPYFLKTNKRKATVLHELAALQVLVLLLRLLACLSGGWTVMGSRFRLKDHALGFKPKMGKWRQSLGVEGGLKGFNFPVPSALQVLLGVGKVRRDLVGFDSTSDAEKSKPCTNKSCYTLTSRRQIIFKRG